MARMRLIRECYQLLKKDDPDTALTMCALRRLVRDGIIPTARSGNKVLVNYDQLLAYLERPCGKEPEADPVGTIRPVKL